MVSLNETLTRFAFFTKNFFAVKITLVFSCHLRKSSWLGTRTRKLCDENYEKIILEFKCCRWSYHEPFPKPVDIFGVSSFDIAFPLTFLLNYTLESFTFLWPDLCDACGWNENDPQTLLVAKGTHKGDNNCKHSDLKWKYFLWNETLNEKNPWMWCLANHFWLLWSYWISEELHRLVSIDFDAFQFKSKVKYFCTLMLRIWSIPSLSHISSTNNFKYNYQNTTINVTADE